MNNDPSRKSLSYWNNRSRISGLLMAFVGILLLTGVAQGKSSRQGPGLKAADTVQVTWMRKSIAVFRDS